MLCFAFVREEQHILLSCIYIAVFTVMGHKMLKGKPVYKSKIQL